MGAHGGSGTILCRFCVDLGILLGTPGEHFGEHLGARVSKWSAFVDFCGAFCEDPFSEPFLGGQNQDFDTPLQPFAWFRWGTGTQKGLHFGSILGAQVATILLFGQPGVQIGCPEARLILNDF